MNSFMKLAMSMSPMFTGQVEFTASEGMELSSSGSYNVPAPTFSSAPTNAKDRSSPYPDPTGGGKETKKEILGDGTSTVPVGHAPTVDSIASDTTSGSMPEMMQTDPPAAGTADT